MINKKKLLEELERVKSDYESYRVHNIQYQANGNKYAFRLLSTKSSELRKEFSKNKKIIEAAGGGPSLLESMKKVLSHSMDGLADELNNMIEELEFLIGEVENSMKDKNNDITKLRRILSYSENGRRDIADLLKYSRSILNESSAYGSRSFSTISSFEIYSPPRQNKKLFELSDYDKNEILQAVLLIYPIKDNAPEVTKVKFYVDFELDQNILVDSKKLEEIDFDYIREQIEKCHQKINDKDFEGAVTNSRNLVESICLYIYEKKKGKSYKYNGDLLRLHKAVRNILKMDPSSHDNQSLKQVLTGIISIVNGIAALRNDLSDAHGSTPSERYKIDERHAVFIVNLSKTVAEYLFVSFQQSEAL